MVHSIQDISKLIEPTPHWRVLLRPTGYLPDRIHSAKAAWQIIEDNRIRLRGWDYPHLSNNTNETATSHDEISCWSTFTGPEYWRLKYSGQFLFLATIQEIAYPAMRDEVRSRLRSSATTITNPDIHNGDGKDISLTIYEVAEFAIFASRIVSVLDLTDGASLSLSINNTKGLGLSAEFRRCWPYVPVCKNDVVRTDLSLPYALAADSLIESIVNACVKIFEQFEWTDPNTSSIRSDVAAFVGKLIK